MASCPISTSSHLTSIAGTVSERDISSSISDAQSTADLAPLASGPITTALLNVLIPPLFEMDFVLTVESVRFPV